MTEDRKSSRPWAGSVLSPEARRDIIARLQSARETCIPCDRPSEVWPEVTLGSAYDLQDEWHRIMLARGTPDVRGYKVGLTDPAAQRTQGAAEPMRGRLHGPLLHGGGRLYAASFLRPRLEVELAFLIGRDIEEGACDVAGVLAAAHGVLAAFEIVDCRTASPRTVVDTVCDNGAFGGIVLAQDRAPVQDFPSGSVHLTVFEGGKPSDRLRGDLDIEMAASAVSWLACHLADRGEKLRQGDLVLSGTCTPAVVLRAGMRLEAAFDGLGGLSLDVV